MISSRFDKPFISGELVNTTGGDMVFAYVKNYRAADYNYKKQSKDRDIVLSFSDGDNRPIEYNLSVVSAIALANSLLQLAEQAKAGE